MKLTFTNLLPGIYFALFGTAIIGIMLWKGEPQLSEKKVIELPQGEGKVTVEVEELMREADRQINLLENDNVFLQRRDTLCRIVRLNRSIGLVFQLSLPTEKA